MSLQLSKLNVIAAVFLVALIGCGQSATSSRPLSMRPLTGDSASSLPAARSPSPVPSPSPKVDLGPAPVAYPGPLPGQGLPLSGPISYPLLIQVENTWPARPQAGIQAASVIFESISEGGITRFSALYHRVPGVVGSVRSARFVSVYLYHRFGALLMASGGSAWTYQKIFADPGLPAIINDFDRGQHFFRWSGRVAPHNLYTSQAQMLAAAAANARLPRSDDFLRSDAWGGTEPVNDINVADMRTVFTYSAGNYGVASDGMRQDDVIYGPVRAQSVAVLHVRQWISSMTEDVTGGKARDFDLTSGGAAELYAHGTVVRGRWDSPADNAPLRLLGPDGQPVGMPPGLLWVSLAE
jgi:hypothetical protein